jgi:hypothetical protein
MISFLVVLILTGIIIKLNEKLERVEEQRDALLRKQGAPLPATAPTKPLTPHQRKRPDHPTAI